MRNKDKNYITFSPSPLFTRLDFTLSFPNPLPQRLLKWHRRMGSGGLQSVHNISALMLLAPHTLPLFQSGVPPTGCSHSGNSHLIHHGVPSWKRCGHLLLLAPLHELQGNSCSSVVSSSSCRGISASDLPPPASSLTLVFTGLFLMFFSSLLTACAVLIDHSWIYFPQGVTHLDDRLSSVLWWVCWIHLCLAWPGTAPNSSTL